MSRWRSALRIARREALRNRASSVLIFLMIAVPVFVVTGGMVVLQTMTVDPREGLDWQLGRADALVEGKGHFPVVQSPDGQVLHVGPPLDGNAGDGAWNGAEGGAWDGMVQDPGRHVAAEPADDIDLGSPWTEEQVLQALPAGSRVVSIARPTMAVRTDHGAIRVVTWAVDLDDSLFEGMFSLLNGRAPTAAGEAAVTPAMADRGFEIGSTVQVGNDATPMQVVGIFERSSQPGAAGLVVAPSSGLITHAQPWLVDTPQPLDWAAVTELNQQGLSIVSRAVVEHPPAASEWDPHGVYTGYGANAGTAAVVGVAGGALLLEVVLLAGPAFAVGARRNRRILALVGAVGGNKSDLRRVVLASAVVLGGGAAMAGLMLGLVVPALVLPVVQRIWRLPAWPYDVDLRAAALVAAFGVLSALTAAYLPARQASRTDVVAALGGRRSDTRTHLRFPIVGAIVLVIGLIVTIQGVSGGEYQITLGTVLSVVGLVLATPWLVGSAGRLAPHLPLALQIAARDAARNRQRTAPAVAAVLAAVTGVTALAIGGTSDFAESRETYSPNLPYGSGWVGLREDADSDTLASALEELVAGRRVTVLSTLPDDMPGGRWLSTGILEPGCTPAEEISSCFVMSESNGLFGALLVGGPQLLTALVPDASDEARSALADGGAVVFSSDAISDGKITVLRVLDGNEEKARAVLPAAAVASPEFGTPGMILSPAAAVALGETPKATSFLIDGSERPISAAEEERLKEALIGSLIEVEHGFTETFTLPLVVLAGVGALLVLLATLTATGLARVDALPDLATLTAVGASPWTSRAVAMGQAAVVAGMGSALGLVAGFIPGIAVTYPLTTNRWSPDLSGNLDPIIDIPWLLLGVVGVVVPLLAVVAAGLFSGRAPSLTRRLT